LIAWEEVMMPDGVDQVRVGLDELRRETEANQRALHASVLRVPDISQRYVLMRSGQVIGYFANDGDALREGKNRFGRGLFSVHRLVPASGTAGVSTPGNP
jgi:hypothetical protein